MNEMKCRPDAKVVMGGSLAVSYITPFFLAFFLVKDPTGGKKKIPAFFQSDFYESDLQHM